MMQMKLNLARKLRLSVIPLWTFVLLGSLLAYWKMHEASSLSQDVAERQMPAVMQMRDLRVAVLESSSALKSYMLFGADPNLAAKCRNEFTGARANSEKLVSQMDERRKSLEGLVSAGDLDAVLGEFRTVDSLQLKAQEMAVGQGPDATGKAFDLLQNDVAQHSEKLMELLSATMQHQLKIYDDSLARTVRLDHQVSVYLWVSVLLGGLLGTLFSEVTIRRVVKSLLTVSGRAQAISEGNLTGEPLVLDSNDEVTSLAQSVNQMQENLREMIGTMVETASIVNHDAVELSRTTADSSHRTEERSQQTRQAAAAMQEMSISIAEVSQHAQNAATSARQASTIAREGGTIVDQMLTGMQSLSDSSTHTAESVRRLGKESEQIIRVVNVIEEIAQKTNLLALNAAIEAARAGEHGRGFAVVAGEVRRLAESTRDATSEIAQTIQGIREHTREAVDAMNAGSEMVTQSAETTRQAGESLKRIIDAADQVDSMIAQIAVAATQQAEAARQSSENIDAINRLGEESAAGVGVTNSIVQSVESGAKRLQEHIGKFRLDDNSHGGHKARQPSPPVSARPAPAFGD